MTSVGNNVIVNVYVAQEMVVISQPEPRGAGNAQLKKPFMSIYDNKSVNTYLEGQCINVTITHVKHSLCGLKDPLYTIELRHGEFQWEVKKTYGDFAELNSKLRCPTNIHFPKFRCFSCYDQDQGPELETYLEQLLNDPNIRNNKEIMMFAEVSPFSFVDGLGIKRKEGEVEMLVPFKCCGHGLCKEHDKRWLIIKDSFIAYTDHNESTIHDVLLMNKDFHPFSGFLYAGRRNGIIATNLSKSLEMQCLTNMKPWVDAMKEAFENSDFRNQNRFNSFAPIRENTYANWFVDGASYMDAVADAIDKAQEEIFISDWWLSPEVNLKRPPTGSESKWRLDKLLKRKAEEGVKIYVLLYKELPRTISNNSQHSEAALTNQHGNIKVMRHNATLGFPDLRWSHHDKMVVIDQTTAFLGGIDLCFGRWDTARHRLADLKHFDMVNPGNILDHKDPGAIRSSQESCVRNLGGDGVVEELSKLHKGFRLEKGENPLVNQLLKQALTEIGPAIGDEDDDTISKASPEGYKIWVGKDYTNYLVKDFTELEKPFEDDIDRELVPRMPWHDIGAVVYGKAARDVARHFIERWNFVKHHLKIDKPDYPLLLPKSYNDIQLPPGVMLQAFTCKVQIVRSSSRWSVGLFQTESSIQTAYINLIKKAKHYIYIENQFFISIMDQNGVKNGITKALYERIISAHRNGETFRVFVIMPLLPSFAGEIETKSGTDLEIITRLNYASICRGKNSLLGKLLEKGITDTSEYISFHGLRTHEKILDKMHSEFIYVHAKLMIVDDEKVIIGSANINDRSMLGDRDSEIAVVVEDTQKCKTVMNGKTCEGGHFASSLRKQLFREHLGLSFDDTSVDISDPVCGSFFRDIWIKQASVNTGIYDKVFKCIPNDGCSNFQETKDCRDNAGLIGEDPVKAEMELQKVKGHIVLFPLSFLERENLHTHSIKELCQSIFT